MKFITIKTVDGERVRVNLNRIIYYCPHWERESVTTISLDLVSEDGFFLHHAGPVEEIDAMIKRLRDEEGN